MQSKFQAIFRESIRRDLLLFFLSMICILFCLSGCTLFPSESASVTDSASVSPASKSHEENEEAAQSFLKVFFAANKEGRYDTFISAMKSSSVPLSPEKGKQELPPEQIEAIENYHRELAALCTEKCLKDIVSERTLSKYDRCMAEEKAIYEIIQINLKGASSENGEQEDFEFELKLQNKENADKTLIAKGQISVEQGKVSRFYLSPIEGLKP
ncbi:MAG: hypothetical protein MSC43_05345 [Clostridiales bacterium]|nr:hypothetical protein [Clostridiales bacterium]